MQARIPCYIRCEEIYFKFRKVLCVQKRQSNPARNPGCASRFGFDSGGCRCIDLFNAAHLAGLGDRGGPHAPRTLGAV